MQGRRRSTMSKNANGRYEPEMVNPREMALLLLIGEIDSSLQKEEEDEINYERRAVY